MAEFESPYFKFHILILYNIPGKSVSGRETEVLAAGSLTEMRVLGLEPKTYGLKGRKPTHNYLSLLALYTLLYVKYWLHSGCGLVTDCQLRQNRDKNDVLMTYGISDKKIKSLSDL